MTATGEASLAKARRPFGAALVGFGYAGRIFHAPLIEACPDLVLRSVVSSQAEAVTAVLPDVQVQDLATALGDESVELVVIATPNHTHAAIAEAALRAGKAVVVDKPFTLTLEEAVGLNDLAQAEGRLLSVFHNRRWDADFLAVGALIESGRLGRVVWFESRFDRYRPQVRIRWREGDVPGAGVWYDLGPHLVDQALTLFGRPLAVTCDLVLSRTGAVAPDGFQALLRYEDKRVALHADMLSAANELRFRVHGERASFVKSGLDPQEEQLKAGLVPGVESWGEDPLPGWIVDGGGERQAFAGPPGDYGAYYPAVAAAMAGGGEPPVSAEEAVRVMEVIEAGILSNRHRREISLQPAATWPPRVG